jgi:hypothetical protein
VTSGRPPLTLILVAVAFFGCTADPPKTAVRASVDDARVVLQPPRGSEDVVLTIDNMGTRPCPLVVFITDDVNGPVDPDRLPVADGVVDFDSGDFHEIEAAEGVEQGGPPIEPGEQRSLTLGFKGSPIVTRVVLCNGAGDYEAGRYAVYQSDGT